MSAFLTARWAAIAIGVVMLLSPWPEEAAGQLSSDAATPSSTGVAAPLQVPSEYASPRDTLRTFLRNVRQIKAGASDQEEEENAWKQVYGTLDMASSAGEARQDVAWRLLAVLDGLGDIVPETMAADQDEVKLDKLTRFELFPDNPYIGANLLFQQVQDELGKPPSSIILAKTRDGTWRFSRQTVEQINQLYGWIERRSVREGTDIRGLSTSAWVRSFFPQAVKNHYFLAIEYWQWLGVFLLILLAVIVDFGSRGVLRGIVRRVTRRYLGNPDEYNVRFAVRPMGLALGAITFLVTLNLIGLTGTPLIVLLLAARVVLTFGIVWASWAITDLISAVLLQGAQMTETTLDDMLIPLVRKSVKLFIVAAGSVYVADSLDVSVAPLLGGLGLAGLAVSFAAQDIVKNVFGGVMIFMDRPFQIGERISYAGFDGVVEEIGFRTTKLRTTTGHLVTIPNGVITSDPVENIGRRPYIRRIMNVGITYDTPRDKIEEGVRILRDLLEEKGLREPIHSVIRGASYPPRVYFNDYTDSSLNIIVIYWYAPPAYWDYLEHAQRLNLRLFEEFERAGIEFAFPTQTLHLAGDPKRQLAVQFPHRELVHEAG